MARFVPLLVAVILAGCGSKPVEKAEIDPEFLAPFKPAPAVEDSKSNPVTEAKVKLGRLLYFEKRLSKDGTVSCNSCHGLESYGVDNRAFSLGVQNQQGGRNSPSVYHAAGHLLQFWDGRAKDVEEQAKGPILNPVEMAMPDAASVEGVLRGIPEYGKEFAQAFPEEREPVTFDNAARAIAAFERKLMTRSRWDQFLEGDKGALTEDEKRGFLAFYKAGCHTCHNGPHVGGLVYVKLGRVKPWPNQKDQGRFEVTKQEFHRMVFKAPSLRNIEKTGPYFHDGSVTKLDEAVRLMGEHQVERPLTDEEAGKIVTWLRCLTGELPKEYIAPPQRN